jgi:hypothetical protein
MRLELDGIGAAGGRRLDQLDGVTVGAVVHRSDFSDQHWIHIEAQ